MLLSFFRVAPPVRWMKIGPSVISLFIWSFQMRNDSRIEIVDMNGLI